MENGSEVSALPVIHSRPARGLMPVKQRQHAQVFRTAGGLLGPDHIGEVCDDHLYLTDAKAVRVERELGVASFKP